MYAEAAAGVQGAGVAAPGESHLGAGDVPFGGGTVADWEVLEYTLGGQTHGS